MSFNSTASKLSMQQPFNGTLANDNPGFMRPKKSFLSLDFSQVRNSVLQQTRKFHSNDESEIVQTEENENLTIMDDYNLENNLASSQYFWNRKDSNHPCINLNSSESINGLPIENQRNAKENDNICHCISDKVECFCQIPAEEVAFCINKKLANDQNHDTTAKDICFDERSVPKNLKFQCYGEIINSLPVSTVTNQLNSEGNETATTSAKLLVENGDSELVVLNSPDLEMLKLSTPDLDNYLIQLQKELSVPISAYQQLNQHETIPISSASCYHNSDTPQMETLELSDILPVLTKNDYFNIETQKSAVTTVFSTATAGQNFTENALSPMLKKLNVIATINSHTERLSLSRDMVDLAHQVSMETRFNSFDSGFSDLSVKTELESEIEDEHGEEPKENRTFKNSKAEIISQGFHCQPANTCGFNHSSNHFQYTQSNLHYGSTDLSFSHGCGTGVRSSLCAGGFSDNQNSRDRLQISCSKPVHQSHHHKQMQHQEQFHQKQNQSNYPQKYETKKKCENEKIDNFSIFTNDENDLFRFITKKAIKKETLLYLDLRCNDVHVSSAGVINSDYSSFVDEKKTLFSQEAASQCGLNSFSMQHKEPQYSEQCNSSATTTTAQNKKNKMNDVELFQGRHVYGVETICSSDATHNQPALHARRMHFKRQNAETEFGNLEIISEQRQLNACSQLSEYTMAKPVAASTTTRSESSGGVVSAATGMSIDIIEQELAKLQRKRAKNRLAATRCRNRKLERINFLKSEVEFLKDINSKYVERINILRQEVDRLKCDVTRHVTSGCDFSYLVSLLR